MKRQICLLIMSACATSCGSTTDAPKAGPPVNFSIIKGNSQLDTVAKSLRDTLVAKLTDAANIPVPNAVVSWVGDGQAFATATQTNSAGETRNIWTLGTSAGQQRIEARWVDPTTGAAKVLGVFTATAVPGVATRLAAGIGALGVLVGQRSALDLTAQDTFGNRIASSPALFPHIAGVSFVGDSISTDREIESTFDVIGSQGRVLYRGFVFRSLFDLRPFKWSADFSCIDRQAEGRSLPDSTRFVLKSDSMSYTVIPGPRIANTAGWFYMRGQQIRHWVDGVTDTVPARRDVFIVQVQPGQVEYDGAAGLQMTPNTIGTSDGRANPTYTGGTWCETQFPIRTNLILSAQ